MNNHNLLVSLILLRVIVQVFFLLPGFDPSRVIILFVFAIGLFGLILKEKWGLIILSIYSIFEIIGSITTNASDTVKITSVLLNALTLYLVYTLYNKLNSYKSKRG